MKILFVTDINAYTGSWVGRYKPLLTELSKKGHHVNAILPGVSEFGDKQNEILNSRFTINYTGKAYRSDLIAQKKQSSLTLIFISVINLILNLYKGLVLEYDVIFVGKPLPVSATTAKILSLIKRKPIHLDCDDYELHTNLITGRIQHLVIKTFEDFFPRYCHQVSTHNTFLANRLETVSRTKTTPCFIPNGIDSDRLDPFFPGRPNNELKTILYFGDLNLSTGHSIDILLKAYKIILLDKGFKSTQLVIAGTGRDYQKMRALGDELGITEHIRWLGRIEPNAIGKQISGCHIVVDPVAFHPGNLSRCPLKILEAMYMGKPVVTSDVGDRKRYLKDLGIYSEIGSSNDLARKIIETLNNKNLMRSYPEKLISMAEPYQWCHLSDTFEQILKKLVK